MSTRRIGWLSIGLLALLACLAFGWRVRHQYRTEKSLNAAIEMLDSGLESHTEGVDTLQKYPRPDSEMAELYAGRGQLYLGSGRAHRSKAELMWILVDTKQEKTVARESFQLAIADFNRAIELDPGNQQAYAGRADTYRELGQTEKAAADDKAASQIGSLKKAASSPHTKQNLDVLTGFLKQDDTYLRQQAARALTKAGPAAKAVLPVLLELAEEGRNPREVIQVLKAMEAAALPAAPLLVEFLQHEDDAIRDSSVDALVSLGPDAVATLSATLKSEHPTVRANGALALERLGSRAEEAVPSLIELLHDDDSDCRLNAVRALGSIGPAATPARPALVGLLSREKDDLPIRECIHTLESLGLPEVEEVEGLIGVLKRPSDEIRSFAIRSLIALQLSEAALSPIISLLRDDDSDVRRGAVQVLENQPQITANSLPLLLTADHPNDPGVHEYLMATIARMGPDAIPGLMDACRHGSESSQRLAADALVRLGAVASSEIMKAFEDQRIPVSTRTEQIHRVAPGAEVLVRGLLGMLQHNTTAPWDRWEIRFQADTLQAYSRQLDFFSLALAVPEPDGDHFNRVYDFNRTPPAAETLSWDSVGGTVLWCEENAEPWNTQLLARAELDTGAKVVLLLCPRQVQMRFLALEAEFARQNNRKPDAIGQTVFRIEGDQRPELTVLRQE